MAFVNVTLSSEAHARLEARKGPGDSFSDVVLREVAAPPAETAGEILDRAKEFEGRKLTDHELMKRVIEGRKRRSRRGNAAR